MNDFSHLKKYGFDIIAQKCLEGNLSVNDIRNNKDTINWDWVSTWFQMDEETIREFRDYVHWNIIKYQQELSKDFKLEFADRLGEDE